MSERTLLFLRHAEAAPTPPGRRDVDRPLTSAGARQAAAVGAALAAQPDVDRVLCSPARRTRETLASLDLRGEPEIEFVDRLYDAGGDDIAAMITDLPDLSRRVLIIGHAPGLPALVHDLADPEHSDPLALAAIDHRYPAATLATITGRGAWSELTGTRLVSVRLGS